MIQAKIIRDDESRLLRWYLKGRFSVGSWSGPPPKGAVLLVMGRLDLFTGVYRLYGPKGKLP